MRQLTEKQSLFCKYMFTVGSDTFSNGTASARKAGYKGNDNQLAVTANYTIRSANIIKRKAEIQAETAAKLDHNRDIAIDKLYADYARLELKANNGDIQAIQARTAIVRELNSISSLHSQVINDNRGLELNFNPARPTLLKDKTG